jgi:hypothetical protein
MNCGICNSSRLRISHFRFEDFPVLLLLMYPIRCRECHERKYVLLWDALRLRISN